MKNELRAKRRAYNAEKHRIEQLNQKRADWHWVKSTMAREGEIIPPLELIPLPPNIDLACGAKTRAGTPCKVKTVFKNGRCKFHGGASTGPRTAEGRARSLANLELGRKRKS